MALVDNRITWDTEETDLLMPSVTLRLIGTRLPARHLEGRGGVRTGMVDISSHATTSGESATLCDAVIDALTPYEAGPMTIAGVTFGGIHLDDVTQSTPSARERYRKAARFIVHVYE